MSGITCAPEVKEAFDQLKLKRAHQFLVLGFSDDFTQVVVKKKGKPGSSHKEFEAAISEKECAFIIYDIPAPIGKMVYILWTPDTAPVKSRMVSSTTSATVLKTCGGLQKSIQCSEKADLSIEAIKKNAKL